MKIKLLTTLGTRDAAEQDLDHAACTCGAELTVTNAVANALLAKGWCEAIPEPIKAVPKEPAIAKAAEPAKATDEPKTEAKAVASSTPKPKKKD